MKSTVSKRLAVCAALSCLAAFGTLAQNQKKEVTEQDVKKFLRDNDKSPLGDWTIPAHSGNLTESHSSSQEKEVRIRNYEIDQPYVETLKFYAQKCDMIIPVDTLATAADFNKGGSHSAGSESASFAVSNRPHALSSTFVRIYPTYSVNVTLYRTSQVPRTHITITRIDHPPIDK